MLDVVILANTLSISTDLRTNSWDYIALLVGYKSTSHVRDRALFVVVKGMFVAVIGRLNDRNAVA